MSSSSRRVTVTVAALGLELDRQLIDLGKPEDRAQLAAINPNAKIPVLVDGELVLWESHAIMQYLCGKVLGQTLYPVELRARADVDRWLFWIASHLSPAVGPISFERMWKKFVTGGDPDPALVERYERFFHQAVAVIDAHLANRTWLSGESPTLADFSVVSTLMYRARTALPLEPYPNVRAHLARVEALEAWRTTDPARVL
jgi:glutathione S-transferase